MALESATYINDLNAANPAATDGLAQADDHFRLIKGAVKATFPNVTGAITATHGAIDAAATFAGAITASAAEINVLDGISAGLTSAELSVLDGVTATTSQINASSLIGTLPVVGTLAEGSVVVGNSSSVASAVAIGAAGTVLKSDGTTISWGDGTPALARGQILYGHADGTTQVLSAGTSGQVLTSDGTDVSWGDAYSGPSQSAGGVGTYAFLASTSTSSSQSFVAGTIYDGSGLKYSGVNRSLGNNVITGSGATVSGKWRAMGSVSAAFSGYNNIATLFVRTE